MEKTEQIHQNPKLKTMGEDFNLFKILFTVLYSSVSICYVGALLLKLLKCKYCLGWVKLCNLNFAVFYFSLICPLRTLKWIILIEL